MQTTNYICDICKTSKSKEDLSDEIIKILEILQAGTSKKELV